ncbi:MAG TPA: 2OG-Fe(II) oxygenase [Candidatus Binatia bacterium]|nr:2OG-Fe(II) oxygenase [Candidatus Binatia bacterium]
MVERLRTLEWDKLERLLFDEGYALIPEFLDPLECAGIRALYDDERAFRSRVVMERHNFGRGEYKYFSYPLPALVDELRSGLYPPLAAIANRWLTALGSPERVPAALTEMLAICADHDQRRPTALLLKYGPGDYNCLHQDLYGAIAFPFQVTFFLSRPHEDFEGGEFVLVEQRPRAQSRPEVVQPRQGDLIVFPNRYRPVRGQHGHYRAAVRHGVSRLRAGERYTLGIIFHDAQ